MDDDILKKWYDISKEPKKEEERIYNTIGTMRISSAKTVTITYGVNTNWGPGPTFSKSASTKPYLTTLWG